MGIALGQGPFDLDRGLSPFSDRHPILSLPPVGIGTRAEAQRSHGGDCARRGEGRCRVINVGHAQKELLRVHIRWMIRRDMPEVLQTEQESFEFSWTEEDFLRCLRQRNCIGMVAEQGEKVVGFMIYELHKNKLHILNFAVHPSCRRLGVGAQMTAKLVSKLSSHRRTRITLEVRETNLVAQLFFRTQGFRAVKVLRNYYEDSQEDAYFMICRHSVDFVESRKSEVES